MTSMNKTPALHIGYDAKRAFFNRSGLGNYSRDLIRVLSEYAPRNHYYLFKHKDSTGVDFQTSNNVSTLLPLSKFYLKFGKLWRSKGISKELKNYPLDIFHGLSQELPQGIEKTKVKTVVTIHDCIFLRYPELFDITYRFIFKRKYEHACRVADRIIAISEQTKQDIIHYFNVPEDKIDVVYQGCNTQFYAQVESQEREKVRQKYALPENYILSVGTIEERKNLMSVVTAMARGKINTPIVIVGRATAYADKVKAFVKTNNIKAIFLHDADFNDFPAIYQMAAVFTYPSLFEGFGIPILEAMNSGVPVITTQGGVFPEVSDDAALYVEYGNVEQMTIALNKVLSDDELRQNMINKGKTRALHFREEQMANNLMSVYQKTQD